MKKNILLFILSASISFVAQAQTVSKIAGVVNKTFPNSGKFQSNGGTTNNISTATFYGPANLAVDKNGRAWIVEVSGNRLRTIDNIASPTTVYSRAGDFQGNSGGTDAAGNVSRFNSPNGVVIDIDSVIYVADLANNCIRKITPYYNSSNAQTVSTFAGINSLSGGYLDAAKASAKFSFPADLAIDSLRNIYVADAGNHCIRKINYTTGAVTTIAGSLNPGNWNGTGAAAAFTSPSGLCFYNSTELLVADPGNANIRKVNVLTGVVTTVAGTGSSGNTDGDALTQATFTNPLDVAVDNYKNIYVVDGIPGIPGASNLLRRISGSCVTTFAGSEGLDDSTNGVGTNARFYNPSGITFYNGALYIADQDNNTIRKVTVAPAGTVPVAYFNTSVNTGNNTTTYTFMDSSFVYTPVTSRVWRFTPNSTIVYQNGTDSTSTNVQVQFTQKANYTVTLIVKNCWGTSTKNGGMFITNTGLDQINNENLFSIYPNPSKGIFELSNNLSVKEYFNLKVTDINGKVIIEKNQIQTKELIDMTGYSKGIYIVRISGANTTLNKKLIIE